MRIFMLCFATLGFLTVTGLCAAEEGKEKQAQDKPAAGKVTVLFDGKTLDGWKSINFGGEGEVEVKDGQIVLGMGEPLTGVVYQKADKLPKDHYEISLEAIKLQGDDFFCGLTFPIRDSHATFIIGGWAGGVVGISSIDNLDASENETTTYQTFESNKWYKVRVRVDGDSLKAWIDDKNFVDVNLKGRKVDTRIEVDVSKPLGISAFRTKSALRKIEVRELEAEKK
jgi:hypothetical protein